MNVANISVGQMSRLLLAMAGLFLLLAVILWFVVGADANDEPRPSYRAQLPSPESLKIGEHYDTIAALQRPLFWPERRPLANDTAVVPAAAGVQAASVEGLKFQGAMVDGDLRYVFINDGARTQKYAEGDELNGWKVWKITADNVELIADGRIVNLALPPVSDLKWEQPRGRDRAAAEQAQNASAAAAQGATTANTVPQFELTEEMKKQLENL